MRRSPSPPPASNAPPEERAEMSATDSTLAPPISPRRMRYGIALGTAVIVASAIALTVHQSSRVNRVALESQPQGVTVVEARGASYRSTRRYVGTIEPWVEARVGPQLIAGYVDSVLVRPGDLVQRGQVIATLDCRNAAASSKAVAMQARALEVERAALAHESARVAELKEGGFASANEIEKRDAETTSKGAQLMETQARMQRASLEVSDCILRAPFTGEISDRLVDPGAFVRPGSPVVTLVDRTIVRVTAEIPEDDFAVVARGTAVGIHALATDQRMTASVARRSPGADLGTRTVHVEIDLADANRGLPIGTTAELTVDVGKAQPATEIPLAAAAVRGDRATVFVLQGQTSQTAQKKVFAILGERAGMLYLDPTLPSGSRVVTEGRSFLKDGDQVKALLDEPRRSAAGPGPGNTAVAGATP